MSTEGTTNTLLDLLSTMVIGYNTTAEAMIVRDVETGVHSIVPGTEVPDGSTVVITRRALHALMISNRLSATDLHHPNHAQRLLALIRAAQS